MRNVIQKIRRVWLKLRSLSVKQKEPDDSKFSTDEKTSAANDAENIRQCYENILELLFLTEAVRDPSHSNFRVNYYLLSDDRGKFLRIRCGKVFPFDAGCNWAVILVFMAACAVTETSSRIRIWTGRLSF